MLIRGILRDGSPFDRDADTDNNDVMSKSKPTITGVLRAAIERSGLIRCRIAQDAGIPEQCLLRFMAGDTSFQLKDADVLATYLGLRLVPDPDAVPPEPTPKNRARRMLAKWKAKPTMTDVLKDAIERSGLTRYRIARDSGVLQSSLSRFMKGERTVRLGKADVLAAYLGLRLADPESLAKMVEPVESIERRPQR